MPNKLTKAGRATLAAFVEDNAHRMQEWLDMIAHGYKVVLTESKDGKEGEFKLVPPNPIKAAEIYQSMVEYHIPKLKSVEVKHDQTKEIEGHVKRYEFHSVTADQVSGPVPSAI